MKENPPVPQDAKKTDEQKRWLEENKEGLEEMRRFFETHGRFSDEVIDL
ncbi:type II toxin-antitoxin system CcdA family antitoxin [Salmonella enterica]